MDPEAKVTLVSSDGSEFVVSRREAECSNLIKDMLEAAGNRVLYMHVSSSVNLSHDVSVSRSTIRILARVQRRLGQS